MLLPLVCQDRVLGQQGCRDGAQEEKGKCGADVSLWLGAGPSKDRVHGTSAAPALYLHVLGRFLSSVVATARQEWAETTREAKS